MDDDRELAAWMRQEALEDCDQILADLERRRRDLEARGGEASEWTPPAPAPVQQRQRQRSSSRNWAAEEAWITRIIDQHTGRRFDHHKNLLIKSVEALGEEAGRLLRELKDGIDRQEARIAMLEARLEQAETRAAEKPFLRLVGFNDAG